MRKIAIGLLIIFLSSLSHSHEGHDHGPGNVQAPKGGILRTLETVHLELLAKGKSIKIHVYDTNLAPAEASKYPVSATVELPRKKSEPLALTAKGDHWEAEFDPKGAHRFTVVLAIKQGGHDDKVKFTVEPKK